MDTNANRLVQFNGEMIDFQLNIDVDHRKRRRNRTTQSCLNCHTSKRKCDRKRPCSRCIQLGLTGLCVYEVDDPAIRDDPNVDEITKLRNRIAELESLVRELRGKPHPRWVDAGPNVSPGAEADLTDKWHTRAFKKQPLASGSLSIKTEPNSDLYHLNQSRHHHQLYLEQQNGHDTHFSPSPPLSMAPSGSSSPPPRDEQYYNPNDFHHSSNPASCRCMANPSVASHILALTQQLQSVFGSLNRMPEHRGDDGCLILDRIADLNNFLHGQDTFSSYQSSSAHHSHSHSHPNATLPPHPHQQFSPLPSPHASEFDHYVQPSHHFAGPIRTPDSDIASSHSASSGGSTFSPCHQIPAQHARQHSQLGSPWYPPAVVSPNSSAGGLHAPSGYNPYFPVSPGLSANQQQQYDIL